MVDNIHWISSLTSEWWRKDFCWLAKGKSGKAITYHWVLADFSSGKYQSCHLFWQVCCQVVIHARVPANQKEIKERGEVKKTKKGPTWVDRARHLQCLENKPRCRQELCFALSPSVATMTNVVRIKCVSATSIVMSMITDYLRIGSKMPGCTETRCSSSHNGHSQRRGGHDV